MIEFCGLVALSLKHFVNALAELAALDVAFASVRDNLDLSTPSGRLIFGRHSTKSEHPNSCCGGSKEVSSANHLLDSSSNVVDQVQNPS